MYQGFSDQPLDEAFDYIAEGLPTMAMLILGRALFWAEHGTVVFEDIDRMRQMAEALDAWAVWTDRGAKSPLAGDDDEALRYLAMEPSPAGIEAWRQMAMRTKWAPDWAAFEAKAREADAAPSPVVSEPDAAA